MKLNEIHHQDKNEILKSLHLMRLSKLIQNHSPGLSAWLLNKSIESQNQSTQQEVQEEVVNQEKIKCEECGSIRLKSNWISNQTKLIIICDYCNSKSITNQTNQLLITNQSTQLTNSNSNSKLKLKLKSHQTQSTSPNKFNLNRFLNQL